MGVIVNRVRADLIMLNESMSVDDITRLLKIIPTGVIPEDDDLNLCSCVGKTAESKETKRAFEILAENILTGSTKMYDCLEKYKSFFKRIKLRKRMV